MPDYDPMETAIYRGQEVEVRDKLPKFGRALIMYHGSRIEVDISELSFLPDKHAAIERLKALTTWDDERRNKFWSLLESHADAHRQLHYPGMEDIDTEDTPVMDDAQHLFTLRRQIAELIGMPPLLKDEGKP